MALQFGDQRGVPDKLLTQSELGWIKDVHLGPSASESLWDGPKGLASSN